MVAQQKQEMQKTWLVKNWCEADREHEECAPGQQLHRDACPTQDLDISSVAVAQLHSTSYNSKYNTSTNMIRLVINTVVHTKSDYL